MIKNFVVKVKAIHNEDKGLKNFLNYLEDEKRHPDGIIKIKQFDKNKFFKQTILNITEHNLNKKAGRKTKNFADSYIFTLPPEVNEKVIKNKEILMKITRKLTDDIYEEIKKEIPEITKKKVLNNIFLNIHKDKKHIHVNVVFPRVLRVGNELVSNRITGRKKFLNNIKKQWNLNLLKNLDLSIEDYKPSTKFKRGYKNQYFKELIEKNNQTLKEIEQEEKKLIELSEIIELKRKDLKNKLNEITAKNKINEKLINDFALLIRYYKALAESIQKNDLNKIKRDYWKLIPKLKQFKNNKIQEFKKITKEINTQVEKWEETIDFSY